MYLIQYLPDVTAISSEDSDTAEAAEAADTVQAEQAADTEAVDTEAEQAVGTGAADTEAEQAAGTEAAADTAGTGQPCYRTGCTCCSEQERAWEACRMQPCKDP